MVDFIISNYFIKYEESILIAQLLAIPLIFIITMKMSAMSLSDYTYVFNKINNLVSAFKLILSLILIPIFHLNGAIISILFIEFLHLITTEFKKL